MKTSAVGKLDGAFKFVTANFSATAVHLIETVSKWPMLD
jgi:hypothetical protein